MGNFSPTKPNKYKGTNKYITFFVTRPRRPTGTDVKQPETNTLYSLGTIWQIEKNPQDGVEGELWILSKIVANVAYWVQIGSGNPPVGGVLTLSDTANTLVFPTILGNIQLEALAGLVITADALNNKLTFGLAGGGLAIDEIEVDAFTGPGTNPVLPSATGRVIIKGVATPNTGVPIRSNSLAVNAFDIEAQVSKDRTGAPGDKLDAGLSSFDDTTFLVDGDGYVQLLGTGAILTLTPDHDFDADAATPISPVDGNINVLTYNPSPTNTFANSVISSFNSNGTSGGDFKIENRSWLTQFVVDSSSTIGERGTYETIQDAIDAASAGDTIFIRPGTYTENITIKNGISLVGLSNSFSTTSNTIIRGKITSTAGTSLIDNLVLQTNSDYVLDISGNSTVNLFRCLIRNASNAFLLDDGNLNLFQCNSIDSGAGSGAWFTATNQSDVLCTDCYLTGSSTTVSTFADDSSLQIINSVFQTNVTTSDSVLFSCYNSTVMTGNRTLTIGGTGANLAHNSSFNGGSSVAVSIGTGVTFSMLNCVVSSTNTNAIDGLGTLNYSGLTFASSSSNIATTTQVPLVHSNDACKVVVPSSYPHTAKPQEAVILVDTSSARTINLNASPVTGQTYRIKDSVGSAAANNITIMPAAGTIDGAASYAVNVNYASVDVVYGGSEWHIV